MNLVAHELKEYIISSLGARIRQEVEMTKPAVLAFGLSTTDNSDLSVIGDDSVAFTLITKDIVLCMELYQIIDQFVREHCGSSSTNTTTSTRMTVYVSHIDGLRHILVNRIHRKLNIAILNT